MPEQALNQEAEQDRGVMGLIYDAQNQQVEDEQSSEVETVEAVDDGHQAEVDEDANQAESSGSADEGEEISSASDLIEHLEADPEWFYSLKMPLTVDGKPAEATLKEMVDSYQIQEAATKKLDDAKQKATEIKDAARQSAETAAQELQVAAAMSLLADQLFMQDLNAAGLDKLKDENPEQYLIAKDQFAERKRVLDAAKQQIRSQLQQTQSGPTPEVVQSEYESLVTAVPALKDEAARARLFEYVTSHGFTPEQIQATPHHQLYVFAEKARMWDELQTKNDTSKKKLTKIPKMVKPSKAEAPEPPKDHASILYGNS